MFLTQRGQPLQREAITERLWPALSQEAAQRERLLALYLRGSERLAAARLVLGQPDAALRLCELIVARDPCWEGAYRLMMEAQAALGNRAQALRAYQRCADALRAELNVAPSPATEAVRARVDL